MSCSALGLATHRPERDRLLDMWAGRAWDTLPESGGTLSRDGGTSPGGRWARTRPSECSEGIDMTTWTKRLLQGAGGCFVLIVLLGIVSNIAFGDVAGTGAETMWIVGTLLEIATVGLLLGAGLSFLVGRVAK